MIIDFKQNECKAEVTFTYIAWECEALQITTILLTLSYNFLYI